MKYLLITGLLFICNHAFTQDTTYNYYNQYGKQCSKDTASFFAKVYEKNGVWERTYSNAKTLKLLSQGSFKEKECKTAEGIFVSFDEAGNKTKESSYTNGIRMSEIVYYSNGTPRAKAEWNEKEELLKATGWDETTGNEIADYIFEREAKFPGGLQEWRRFLSRNLNVNTPVDFGAPAGIFTVRVSFLVDKEGNVSDVRAENNPGYGTAEEAVRVIKKGPKWEPAIQYNKKVIYRQVQPISFRVEEDAAPKKRRSLF